MRRVSWACLGLMAALPGAGGCGGQDEGAGPKSFTIAEVHGTIDPGDIAMDEAGRFFVVWAEQVGGSKTLRARLYDASGEPITAEMQVSSTDLETEYAAVRMGRDGHSVVAFTAEDERGGYESRVRLFDSRGRPRGDDLIVFRRSMRPDVEILPDDSFVVAAAVQVDAPDDPIDRIRSEVHVQRFRLDGQPLGPEQRFEARPSPTLLDAEAPRIRSTPNGSYSVIWSAELHLPPQYTSFQIPPYFGAYSLRFDASGEPGEPQPLDLQPPPKTSSLESLQNRFVELSDGSIALMARGYEQDRATGAQRLRSPVQLLSPTGEPRGTAFNLQSRDEAADIQGQDLAVLGCASHAGCLLVATWTSVLPDPAADVTIYTRIFNASGRPVRNPLSPDGAEFPLDRVRAAGAYPYIGANSRGDVVIVWRKTGGTLESGVERVDGMLYRGFVGSLPP
jgi:hypothetical protein